MKWISESNRPKHMLYAIPCGFVGTVFFAMGLAMGMEFKDKQHGGDFDWLDVAATAIDGVIGQGLQLAVISILL